MMWSKRVVTLLQRASKRRSSSSAGSMPLSLGAALSLVALAEWDRRSSSSSSRNDNHNECNPPMRLLEMMMTSTTTTTTRCDGGGGSALSSTTVPEHPVRKQQHRHLLRHRQTVRKMEDDSSKQSLESRYRVDWDSPLGEGSFGVVFLGVDRTSGQRVAVKKISKLSTGLHEFLLEMRALLHLKDSGGHPNICSLRENFSEDGYYYLILDLVEGCEMFEHLVAQGAYSEADAARLVREVASALAFLHGLGVIHCDLKPENLMLSSKNNSDAVIKLIDFGCAMVVEGDDDDVHDAAGSLSLKGRTLAYCPPEILDQSLLKLDPSVDMWALVSRC